MSVLTLESRCQFCTFTVTSSRDVGACELCPPELKKVEFLDLNELLLHKAIQHRKYAPNLSLECKFCPFRTIDANIFGQHMRHEHGRCSAHFRCYENRCLKVISFDFYSVHIDSNHPPREQLQFCSANMGETISLFGNIDSSFTAHSFLCQDCANTFICSSLVECNLCTNLPHDQQYAGFAKINDFLIHLETDHALTFSGKLMCTFKETGCKFVGSLKELKNHVVSEHNSCTSHVCCSPLCSFLIDPSNYKRAHIRPEQCQFIEPNTIAYKSFINHFQSLKPTRCGQIKSAGEGDGESKSKKVLFFQRNGAEVGKLFYAPVLKLPIAKIDYFTKFFAYKCESCPFVVQLSEESSKLTHHSCPFCHLVFFSLLEAKAHIAQYHRYSESETKSKCIECAFTSDSCEKVIRHRAIAHKFCKEHYLCVAHKSCCKLFSTARNLGRHVMSKECLTTNVPEKEGLLALASPDNLYKCTSCSYSQTLDARNFVQCNRCNDHGRIFLTDEVDFAVHKYLRFQQDTEDMIYLQCADKNCPPKWLRLRDYFNHRDHSHQSCGIHYVCRYKGCRVLMSSLHSLNLHQDMCSKRDSGIRGEELLTHYLHSEIQNLICTYSQSLVSMRYEKYACTCCNELFESSLLVLCKLCSFDISPVVFIDSAEFISHLVLNHKMDCSSKVDCYLKTDNVSCSFTGKVIDAYNHKLLKHGICGLHVKCPFNDCNFLFDDIEKMIKHRSSANHITKVKPIEKYFKTVSEESSESWQAPVNQNMVNYFLELPFKSLPTLPKIAKSIITEQMTTTSREAESSPNDVNEIIPLKNENEKPAAINHASDPRIERWSLSEASPIKEVSPPVSPGKKVVEDLQVVAWGPEIKSRSPSPGVFQSNKAPIPRNPGDKTTNFIPWDKSLTSPVSAMVPSTSTCLSPPFVAPVKRMVMERIPSNEFFPPTEFEPPNCLKPPIGFKPPMPSYMPHDEIVKDVIQMAYPNDIDKRAAQENIVQPQPISDLFTLNENLAHPHLVPKPFMPPSSDKFPLKPVVELFDEEDDAEFMKFIEENSKPPPFKIPVRSVRPENSPKRPPPFPARIEKETGDVIKSQIKGDIDYEPPSKVALEIQSGIGAMIASFRKAVNESPTDSEPSSSNEPMRTLKTSAVHQSAMSSRLVSRSLGDSSNRRSLDRGLNEMVTREESKNEKLDPLDPNNEVALTSEASIDIGPFVSDEANGVVYGHFILLSIISKSLVQTSNKFKFYICNQCGLKKKLDPLLCIHHYVCSECDLAFMCQLEAANHFCIVHNHPIPELKEDTNCELCAFTTRSLESWILHRKDEHSLCAEHIVCPNASCTTRNVFRSKSELEAHLTREGGCLKRGRTHKFDALNAPFYGKVYAQENFLCQQTCVACTFIQYKEFNQMKAITYPKCCSENTFATREDRECHGASIHFKNSAQSFKKIKHSCVNCNSKYPVLLSMLHKVYNHVVCSEHYACPNDSCMLVFPCPYLVQLHHKFCIMTFFTGKQKGILERIERLPPVPTVVGTEWQEMKAKTANNPKPSLESLTSCERMSDRGERPEEFAPRDRPQYGHQRRDDFHARGRDAYFHENRGRGFRPNDRNPNFTPRGRSSFNYRVNGNLHEYARNNSLPFYQQSGKVGYQGPSESRASEAVRSSDNRRSNEQNRDRLVNSIAPDDFDLQGALSKMRRESSISERARKNTLESDKTRGHKETSRSRSRSISESEQTSGSRSRSRDRIATLRTREEGKTKSSELGGLMDDFLKQARYGKE